ncbi:BolA family protein [Emcibacter nanhaiensis]|uniref:BolA family transcriptional regulator n=1 Tax=Emcibacter nanhaiensis TaxID=1505037 RepID=A0A501PND8_9PROT|nr:BolA family protein [Emcibacter nanhaiensis]TPD61805.1 BolA family transcriptional regulator [Emcibacter nanhaiensis]
MKVAASIREKLTRELAPAKLDVIDQSCNHAGHSGTRPEGETHFHVVAVAAAFDGLNRVARQRLVYKILADELAGPVHALSLDLKSPAEAS